MTNYFRYENLTWPEIAALPRNTPLVIPLGDGYALDTLSDALGNPDTVGLLPAIPYGWRGSGLTVTEALLSAILENLVNSLREDGFSRVYAITPQGMQLRLPGQAGEAAIILPHPSQFMRPEQLPNEYARDQVVVIPIGHTEQHAFHLPMSTDTLIIEAIAAGCTNNQKAVNLPVMPYGVSTHRAAFAGTLNAGARAFEDFYIGVIDTLVERGFDRFYLMSGHGGNCSYLVNVIKAAGERHRHIFCATSWLYLSGPSGVAAIEKYRQSPRGGMGHACELETSLILHLQPELVHMPLVVDELDYVSTPSYYMDWVEGGALIANPPWDDDTITGSYGAGSLGTPEKGALWLQAAIEEKIAHIDEIHEQFTLRTARRKAGYGLWSLRDQTFK